MEAVSVDVLKNSARIWVYQADRILNEQEVQCISKKLERFLSQWNTHGKPLAAEAWLDDSLFIVLAVDEDRQLASGCSIDQSVHFIREIGSRLNIDFFDRMTFSYRDTEGNPQLVGAQDLPKLYKKGVIEDETLFYDTLVTDKGKWKTDRLKPLINSWQTKFL
ncbi:hypothetical protein [Membranihabitans maritimus]|uniref:hypothetical protein n=1 Tax=Membranihabitans maritimus TaxID=2904244 RepID=UPI001F3066CA|nr:hypothetical protein [Membranihabitans maritimus]